MNFPKTLKKASEIMIKFKNFKWKYQLCQEQSFNLVGYL